jgi:hypothetical protein
MMTPSDAKDLTIEQKAANFDLMVAHIAKVRDILCVFREELDSRADHHDDSKMLEPEVSTFVEFNPKLESLDYDSDEYKKCLKDMGPALDHHYKCNANHHPEGTEDGIDGMTLPDVVEMFADWAAAATRHTTGNLFTSLEKNRERFHMDDQLFNIFFNTAEWLKELSEHGMIDLTVGDPQ